MAHFDAPFLLLGPTTSVSSKPADQMAINPWLSGITTGSRYRQAWLGIQ
jgi:hypothetical protein